MKNTLLKQYPVSNCINNANYTLTQITDDYNLGIDGKGYLECYCSASISQTLYQVFPNGQQLCKEWLQNKLNFFGITFIAIFSVLFINMIMEFIFKALSKFERHRTVTELLGSTVIKIFFAQYLNTVTYYV